MALARADTKVHEQVLVAGLSDAIQEFAGEELEDGDGGRGVQEKDEEEGRGVAEVENELALTDPGCDIADVDDQKDEDGGHCGLGHKFAEVVDFEDAADRQQLDVKVHQRDPAEHVHDRAK